MPDPRDQVLALVERCVAAAERGDAGAVQEVLRAHPDAAEAVRSRLAWLAGAGLLSDVVARSLDALPSFGVYEVAETIGTGGMGTVWRARQREPVEREIALKVIRGGTDSRELLGRFETERRTLALMNHANIARLYDAGVTPQGRSYFAMELVDGTPITEFADAHRLTPRQRLELLLPVLDAVQHAHQRGVIHRDLKPSNVLVAEQDGSFVPKVIDFGVAKALEESGLPATTSFTLDGRFVGTPAYMSPEQADGAAADVDVRSDVYALGVLLYELMTGELPIDRARLESAGLRELAGLLLEHETPAPSVRVGRIETVTEIATARRTTPTGLRRALHGEVDWVVLRALEKERERRYQSVRELADDIRRLLDGQPVQAGARSVAYRVRKFVRRHRALVAGAAVGLTALAAGLVATLVSAAETGAARIRAERNLAAAMRAVDEMLSQVGARHLEHVPHMGKVRRQLLERALAFYEELLGRPGLGEHVEVLDTRLAKVEVLELLGDYGAAETELDAVLAELASGWSDVDDLELRQRRAIATKALANVYARTGRLADARSGYERALAEFDALRAVRPDRREFAIERANALNNLGTVIGRRDPAAASAMMAEAVSEFRRLVADQADPELAAKAATTQVFVGARLWDAGRQDEALAALEQARTDAQDLVGTYPQRVDVRRALGLSEENIGLCGLRSGDLTAAEPHFVAAGRAFRELVADFPSVPEFRQSMGRCLSNLAAVYGQRGDSERAAEILEETVEHAEALVRLYPDALALRFGLVSRLLNLVAAEINLSGDSISGRGERALARALELTEHLYEKLPGDPQVAMQRAGALRRAAQIASIQGAIADARELIGRARGVIESVRTPSIDPVLAQERFSVQAFLAELALRSATGTDERREAESAVREVIATAIASHPSDRDVRITAAGARLDAARVLLRVGDRARAMDWLRDPDDFVVGDVATVLVSAARAAARGAELARDDRVLASGAREREFDAWSEVLGALLDRAKGLGVDTPSLLEAPAFAAVRRHPRLASHAAGH